MKHIIFLLLLLPALCYANKDICRKIKKTSTREKGIKIITYQSPELLHLTAFRQVKADTMYALSLQMKDDQEHFERKGAAVEFDDGTILESTEANVNCIQEMSGVDGGNSGGGMAHSGRYRLQAFFNIKAEHLDKFTSRKIVRIRVDNAFQKIPAKESLLIMKYLRCMGMMK